MCAGDKIVSGPESNGGSKPPLKIISVNECILRPHICGEGQCIDTADGYECRCKPGYREGPSQVCEG